VTRRKTTEQMRELGRWPAHSPELNLQEHASAWIERKLKTMKPIYERMKLMKVLGQLGEEWDLNCHRNACRSYEDRLWSLIEKEGGQICGRFGLHNAGTFLTSVDVAEDSSDDESDKAGPSCQLFTAAPSTSARRPKATKATKANKSNKSKAKPRSKRKGKGETTGS
jgi:hypothetical protein